MLTLAWNVYIGISTLGMKEQLKESIDKIKLTSLHADSVYKQNFVLLQKLKLQETQKASSDTTAKK